MSEMSDPLQVLIEQTHREVNAERVAHGSAPLNFERKVCACGCGQEFTPTGGRSMFAHGHGGAERAKRIEYQRQYRERQKAKKNGVPSETPAFRVGTDDFSGLVNVLDQQITAIAAKLEKLRAVRAMLKEL